MSEAKLVSPAPPLERPGVVGSLLHREMPYVVMLVLALVGIAYADLLPAKSLWYWQLLAILYGLIAVLTEWPRLPSEGPERLRLIATQVFHWGAFLLAMQLLFLPVMQKNLNSDITGLVLEYVLALSTFLAGIYINWRLCVVGLFLAIGVPVVAFVDQASALMAVVAITVIAAVWLWQRSRPGREAPRAVRDLSGI
jgi:hypothetical protein